MSPEVARRVVALPRQFRPPETAKHHLPPTSRACSSCSSRAAATRPPPPELGVTAKTVSFHLQKIHEKFQVHSRSQVVAKALRDRLIR